MSDHAPAPMPSSSSDLTFDAFLSDRQQIWGGFTRAFVYGAVSVVILLVLMWIFLV